jgi:hypothetical protein
MAHYQTRVRTTLDADRAFAYVADLRNFENWDPGVESSIQVSGDGPGVGAAYDVTVDNGGRTTTLRYEVTDYEPARYLRVVGENSRFVSIDVIEVEPADGGSIVTYDATLRLKGILRLADRFLARAFDRIGDNAASGLEAALDGTIVPS